MCVWSCREEMEQGEKAYLSQSDFEVSLGMRRLGLYFYKEDWYEDFQTVGQKFLKKKTPNRCTVRIF